ncbi:MAG: tRNA lysidine(34) synthetase TilS [Pseudomonadota bacterium]
MASSKRHAPADPSPAPAEAAGLDPCPDLKARVGQFLARHLPRGGRVCLGYSGGLDSTVLLHLLAALSQAGACRLSAVHVHHGLSAQADAWAAHCAETCARLGVPLETVRVRVVPTGHGLEAAAREARYRVFKTCAADALVLAHHRDDQAETVLLRLLRGAGVAGLAGMAEDRAWPGLRILRPLLDVSRATLEACARAAGWSYVEDPSNADPVLSRNWLRGEVLPLLARRQPGVSEVLARTAGHLAEAAGLLDQLARMDWDQVGEGRDLRVADLIALEPARARNLLRLWLREGTGSVPTQAWLAEALDQLREARPDRQPSLVLGAWRVRRQAGRVVLAPSRPATVFQDRCWRGEPRLCLDRAGSLVFELSVGQGLAAALLPPEGLRVAGRRGGERLRPDCQRPRRTVKNLLREAGVPPAGRAGLPMLWLGDQLVWVAGLGFECRFQAAPGQPGWLISWRPPDP